ncbi:glutamine synthetase [Sphaerospermopsis aphanizomenoides BCCUSP55]|uniref:glutamine synthetase family protein n=1 Tax=Sphaerospermopsis aphanizomenoides TaxID=459663 RepID=UPI001908E581|nr:glutamine synthetase family protein [Sphaerospermopsis aphanizomenoides]MBK1986769.1 glutamine synthetase [Sphaerospermopsis aphanizomenoides BCCUSP55]
MTENKVFKKVKKSLQETGVKFVRVLWCDNANIIRAKAIHSQMLLHYWEDGVGISPGLQALPVMYDSVMAGSGLTPVGNVQLVPDWQTLTPLPYSPGHARVFSNMIHKGQPWALCPRGFLLRMIEEAKKEGLEIKAAFENEFYLLQKNGEEIIGADATVFAATASMDANLEVINDIADALILQEIPVEQYYPESGPGQQEISMRYTEALAAADWQVVFRETVKAIADRHYLTASFLPKIFAESAGNGCHIHLSLWRDGKNITPNSQGICGLSPLARSFVAGILHHLPALMAITTPSPNSYRRIRPHFWSGAFRCWGLDNKEAPVRVISSPRGDGSTNFELKTVDATANPYLALGAVIAAGLDGIRNNLEPMQPVSQDPGYLPLDERINNGISSLPENLGQAIAHLQQDDILLTALTPQLSQAFLAVRQAEWEAMKDWELEAEVKLLLARY